MVEININARYYPIAPPKFVGRFTGLPATMAHAAKKKMEGYRVEVRQVTATDYNIAVTGKMDRQQPAGAHIIKARIHFTPFGR